LAEAAESAPDVRNSNTGKRRHTKCMLARYLWLSCKKGFYIA
jgi:hypothetical protein